MLHSLSPKEESRLNLCLIFDTVYFESRGGTYPFLTLSRYSAPRTAFFDVFKISPTLLAVKLLAIKYLASSNCVSVHSLLAMLVPSFVSFVPSLVPSPHADLAPVSFAQKIKIIFNSIKHHTPVQVLCTKFFAHPSVQS